MPTAQQCHTSAQKCSAAQPATYLDQDPSSAEQPAIAQHGKEVSFCRLAFYNIGWQSSDKKRRPENLATLLNFIRHKKTVHAFGISEVFNISDNDKDQKRQEIMTTYCLNLMKATRGTFGSAKLTSTSSECMIDSNEK